MKWIQYKIHTTTDVVDTLGEILYELGIYGFEISDNVPLTEKEENMMFTGIPAQLPPDDGSATITFYTEGENEESEKEFYSTGSSLRDERLEETPDAYTPEELIQKIRERIKELQSFFHFPEPEIDYSIQDDSQWKDKWKDNFKAFRVTEDIVVKPVWEEVPDFATDNDTIIEIEPGSAFGTGTHETTQLCLVPLKKYLTTETRLMDAGCGSGILAICALLSGAKSAFCLDIDPSAVSGTLENAALNNLGPDRLEAVLGNILENPEAVRKQCPEPFDVIVANILADVIVPLTDYIRPFLKKDGVYITSGILAEKAADVEAALQKNRFYIIEKNVMGEWVSFVAKPY